MKHNHTLWTKKQFKRRNGKQNNGEPTKAKPPTDQKYTGVRQDRDGKWGPSYNGIVRPMWSL